MPFAVAGVRSPLEEDKKYISWMMKSITQSIIKAEKKCADDPASTGALRKIIDRIYFRFNRFARMTMARCHKANYAPDHPELQATAEFLGAGSNTTADIMEGTINNLQRKTWVVGKKMNVYVKWFGASSATSLKTIPQVSTDTDDYVQAASIIARWWRNGRNTRHSRGSAEQQSSETLMHSCTQFKSARTAPPN